MPRLVALLVLAGVAVSALRPRRAEPASAFVRPIDRLYAMLDPVDLAMIERERATVH